MFDLNNLQTRLTLLLVALPVFVAVVLLALGYNAPIAGSQLSFAAMLLWFAISPVGLITAY